MAILDKAKYQKGDRCKIVKNLLSPESVGQIVTILEVCVSTSNKYFYKTSTEVKLSDGTELEGYAAENCLELVERKS